MLEFGCKAERVTIEAITFLAICRVKKFPGAFMVGCYLAGYKREMVDDVVVTFVGDRGRRPWSGRDAIRHLGLLLEAPEEGLDVEIRLA